jgi:5-formyltetrahydrofolate cyclo-ligase
MIPTRKAELRKQMRAQRLSLSSAEVAAKSAAIRGRLLSLPAFVNARKVLAYASRGSEVATHELLSEILASGRELGVPMFDAGKDAYRTALIHQFPGDMLEGKLQILEPNPATARPVGIEYFDALLIPGLAFDGRGSRLGRGKGYFDRLLETASGVKIALAYDFEVLTEVPVDDHDVHMDFIVTETKVVHCKRTDQ